MRKKFLFSLLILPLLMGIGFGESLKIVSPKRGDAWFKGENYVIKWVNYGKIPQKVKIRLYQGDKKILRITDSTENTGSFKWTIPMNLPLGKYYIRVKTVDNKIFDNGEIFEIREAPKGKIYIISPLDGDYWQKGKKYHIKWRSEGEINSNVKIRLYKGNEKILKITDNTLNDGDFLWEIPQSIKEGSYYIRVKTVDNQVYDNSDDFIITDKEKGEIKVIYPNGGERIGAPETLEIRWKASPEIKYVRILGICILKGKVEPVKQFLAERENTGKFSVQLSEKVYNSKKYKIRVEDYNNPPVYDESDGYFEIYHINKPYLKVISPKGGENSNIGDNLIVRWEAKGFDLEVKAELWKGNTKIGTIFEDLTMSQAVEGKRLWKVGEIKERNRIEKGSGYFIKLIAKNNNSLWSSSGVFSIGAKEEGKPFIKRISPTKGYAGTEIEIFGKNFHSNEYYRVAMRGTDKRDYGLDIIEWKDDYIKGTTKSFKNILKKGIYKIKIYKYKGKDAYTERTSSNEVNFEILEKKNCLLKILKVWLSKPSHRYKIGETVKYFFEVKNVSNVNYSGRIYTTIMFDDIRKGVTISHPNFSLNKGGTTTIQDSVLIDFIKTPGAYKASFDIIEKQPRGKQCFNKYESYLTLIFEEEEKYDLKATNCAYVKNVFSKGEIGEFSITPYNLGPSTVSGYKITAWSVRGDGKSSLAVMGKTMFSVKVPSVLKSKQSKMESFKAKINDSPGDYTLFIKVEAEKPPHSLDVKPENNTCKNHYKVVYKTYNPFFKSISLPDLMFVKLKTKSGPRGIEIGIKNPYYKSAKIPINKDIRIMIKNISERNYVKNSVEISIPVSVINELNNKGETIYITGLNISYPRYKIILDSKNIVKEANERNNELILVK